MGALRAECEDCGYEFDPDANTVNKAAAMGVGALSGGYVGSGTGLALGPLGAINGAGVGAVVGAGAVALGEKMVARCPYCDEVQFV